MIPVDQDRFGQGEGNCFAACLASLTETRLETWAEYHERYLTISVGWDALTDEGRLRAQIESNGNASWWDVTVLELARRGWVSMFSPFYEGCRAPAGYTIATGENQDGVGHSCVALDGDLVFDPNPNRRGLKSIDHYVVLVPASDRLFSGKVVTRWRSVATTA